MEVWALHYFRMLWHEIYNKVFDRAYYRLRLGTHRHASEGFRGKAVARPEIQSNMCSLRYITRAGRRLPMSTVGGSYNWGMRLRRRKCNKSENFRCKWWISAEYPGKTAPQGRYLRPAYREARCHLRVQKRRIKSCNNTIIYAGTKTAMAQRRHAIRLGQRIVESGVNIVSV